METYNFVCLAEPADLGSAKTALKFKYEIMYVAEYKLKKWNK